MFSNTHSENGEALAVEFPAGVGRLGVVGNVAAASTHGAPMNPTDKNPNPSELSTLQRPLNKNFCIVVCNLEDAIAQDGEEQQRM